MTRAQRIALAMFGPRKWTVEWSDGPILIHTRLEPFMWSPAAREDVRCGYHVVGPPSEIVIGGNLGLPCA